MMFFAGAMVFGFGGKAEAQSMLASWYGPGFEGNPTASGEPYNPYGYTAAHKTLPLGTQLVVSYGGQSVQVTVNDRGPYVGDRELDLSQGAAEALGLTGAGVDYVTVSSPGGGYESTGYDSGGYYSGGGYSAPASGYSTLDSSGSAGYSGGGYVVQPGDTLAGVAANLGTSVEQLAAANGIADPNLILSGQTIYY
jgi:rare lipoprotein A